MRGEQISATQTYHRGGMRVELPAAWRFFGSFWKKMAILMRFGPHFARFQSHLKEKKIFDV